MSDEVDAVLERANDWLKGEWLPETVPHTAAIIRDAAALLARMQAHEQAHEKAMSIIDRAGKILGPKVDTVEALRARVDALTKAISGLLACRPLSGPDNDALSDACRVADAALEAKP